MRRDQVTGAALLSYSCYFSIVQQDVIGEVHLEKALSPDFSRCHLAE